jgi:hypothetical protein
MQRESGRLPKEFALSVCLTRVSEPELELDLTCLRLVQGRGPERWWARVTAGRSVHWRFPVHSRDETRGRMPRLPTRLRIRERIDLTGEESPPLNRKRVHPGDDDEVLEVLGPGRASQSSQPVAALDKSDDEVIFTKRGRGADANRDLPHARPQCGHHPFEIDSMANVPFCGQCYCWCCDIPARECNHWYTHCQAHMGATRWVEARATIQRLGAAASTSATSISDGTLSVGALVYYYQRPTGVRLKATVLKHHAVDDSFTILLDGGVREVDTVRERLRPAQQM